MLLNADWQKTKKDLWINLLIAFKDFAPKLLLQSQSNCLTRPYKSKPRGCTTLFCVNILSWLDIKCKMSSTQELVWLHVSDSTHGCYFTIWVWFWTSVIRITKNFNLSKSSDSQAEHLWTYCTKVLDVKPLVSLLIKVCQ